MAYSKTKLLNQYDKLIHNTLHRYNTPTHLYEDAYSHLKLHMFQCITKYDKTKSALSTYLYIQLSSAAQTFLLKNQHPYGMSATYYYLQLKHKTIPTVDFELVKNEVDVSYREPQNEELHHIITQKFIKKVNHKYDAEITQILIDYYLLGCTYKQLKAKYGNVTRKIRQIIKTKQLDTIFSEIRREILDA